MCAAHMIGYGHSERDESEYSGIPSTAQAVAENEYYVVFLNDEAIGDSIEGLGAIKQVSLWTFDKDKKSAKKILLSHPNADASKFSMEHSVTIPQDSIPTISKVIILSWRSEPLKLLVEGCSDYRNVESFIIDTNSDQAICLPTNRGLIGISEEECLLIMQSYAYYEGGGRYNIIEAYDQQGNRIASMDAKMSK
jgi:sporulation protein YlmC with PRC-barrel domain